MLIFSLINPKGGATKSTTANLLATSLARKGAKTLLFETDKNVPQLKWALGCMVRWGKENEEDAIEKIRQGKKRRRIQVEHGENLTVLAHADAEDVIPNLEWAAEQGFSYAVVDTEGTGDEATTTAMSQSDVVILPIQPSRLDADCAEDALSIIHLGEKKYNRQLLAVAVVTACGVAVKSRIHRMVREELEEKGVNLLPCEIAHRAAYREMYEVGCTLQELQEYGTSNLDKAIQNADEFADSLLHFLANSLKESEA